MHRNVVAIQIKTLVFYKKEYNLATKEASNVLR